MLLLRLRVVLLAVDAGALAVLAPLDAPLLFRAHLAVGAGARFGAIDARFAALEFGCLARGEAAGLHALLDACLLVDVALHVGLHALRGGRVRIAGLRVVLLAVDVAADLVLLAREAGLLPRAESAVAKRPGLIAFDLRFLALEARGFAGGALAGFEALLDALLLVDVALDGAGLGKGAAAEEGCGDGSQFEFHLDVPLRWSAMPFNAAAREVEYRTPP